MRIVMLCALLGFATIGSASSWRIISWAGNTPESNVRLGVDELRLGCSGTAQRCLSSLDAVAKRESIDAVVLALGAPRAEIAVRATELARASLTEPRLRAIGLDDFVRTLARWAKESGDALVPADVLRDMLDGASRENPRLGFAVTVYEDQLESPLLVKNLPYELRARITRVSLYLHYRRNADGLPEYVSRAHQLFPGAEIIGGVYAYDRREYLPCRQGARRKCSAGEEAALFTAAFTEQVDLLGKGELAGLEFYPGAFGLEQDWSGWGNPRVCPPGRKSECIAHTLALREAARKLLPPRGRDESTR
jgi:hypothetical protein